MLGASSGVAHMINMGVPPQATCISSVVGMVSSV